MDQRLRPPSSPKAEHARLAWRSPGRCGRPRGRRPDARGSGPKRTGARRRGPAATRSGSAPGPRRRSFCPARDPWRIARSSIIASFSLGAGVPTPRSYARGHHAPRWGLHCKNGRPDSGFGSNPGANGMIRRCHIRMGIYFQARRAHEPPDPHANISCIGRSNSPPRHHSRLRPRFNERVRQSAGPAVEFHTRRSVFDM